MNVDQPGLSRGLSLLMALACGLIVANLYYAQPLLPNLAVDFRVSSDVAGLAVVFAQLGYVLGLAFLVPLGDRVTGRPLIVCLLAVNAAALVVAALAPGVWALMAALTVIGVAGSAISLLILLAASLDRRNAGGAVVGTLMTGLLIGILLARTVAGAVQEVAGWRAVYGGSAALIALLALVLRARLPRLPVTATMSYPMLLGSIAGLIRSEGFLRRRMAFGFLAFACTQLLWSALPLLLSRPPYGYDPGAIGLFGLLGAAGALVAHGVGRLHDRGLAHRATGALVLLTAASWTLTGTGAELVALMAGVALSSAAVQGVHVLNQARLLAYPPGIRSRVTTAYMTSYFLGGTLGGGIAAPIFNRGGWTGVAVTGVVLCAIGAALWFADRTAASATVRVS
ncbi:MFS transporter [Nonomuraea sp. B19D2]|uniref:MFS transporter n=1 Tax=Nonomuraea sp. B19D2 TaxID=3159561 RepID=UPI0032DADD5F